MMECPNQCTDWKSNSFCHKEYGTGQNNEVSIYKDRVEIYNPGTFPAGYKPEDFISGRERPIRRNPLIAQTLYYSKNVESFGTGLRRIADACDDAGCDYKFEVLKSGFVVTFYRQFLDEEDNLGGGGGTPQAAPKLNNRLRYRIRFRFTVLNLGARLKLLSIVDTKMSNILQISI